MAAPGPSDIGVDVAILGGGLAARILAGALHPRRSVCVVDDPAFTTERSTVDGYVSAGYGASDAREAASERQGAATWRLWAARQGIEAVGDTPWCTLPAAARPASIQRWADAGLAHEATGGGLPRPFDAGAAAGEATFRLLEDLVVRPGEVLARARRPVEHRWLDRSVVRFRTFGDGVVDAVELEDAVDRRSIAVAPRLVVLAADGGNATLLGRLAMRLDGEQRDGVRALRDAQVAHRRTVVGVRGSLPLVSGRFGGCHVVAQPLTGSSDVAWLVRSTVESGRAVHGEEDLRFEPPLDRREAAALLARLLATAPELVDRAEELRWGAWTRRETAGPAGAGVHDAGLPSLLALWCPELSASALAADAAAEWVERALGGRGARGAEPDEPLPATGSAATEAPMSWDRPDGPWRSWSQLGAELRGDAPQA